MIMHVNRLLPTTVVGSLPQPDWLLDRDMLRDRLPARVRTPDLWRVAPDLLETAQDDATLLAIRDMERAGVDIITDGEIRRESYSNRFATALDGMDLDNPAEILSRAGKPNKVPRVDGQDPPPRAGGGPRPRVPAAQHRPPGEDHRCPARSP